MKLHIVLAALVLIGVCSLATIKPAPETNVIVSVSDGLPIPCPPIQGGCGGSSHSQ
jgi:hypothetical protein